MSRLAPLDVRWSASTAATSYFVGFDAFPAGMATIVEPAARSFTFDAPRDAFVEARVDPEDGQRFVTTALARRRSFFVGE